ncbi:MAG: ABC transporter ATP-binding protein/permease [Clostridia bacterium]|nr:ABC transporter ATP-binding protein/permease [Clostridia bacterium]
MLETVNLGKIYRSEKGVSVTALDNVSIKFSDSGMVFLLGKSGSGKSTLLNLLGGLDKCDSGQILIKGQSTADFKQSHFDSYRNTCVGFVFQEYNMLEEFTVGANIAIAIELQGKKATDQQINEILHQVDLDGYGDRKPNELSGGQKQRVAIARALVKNPEIIMADEPTGALDSNTGRNVFETLKRLSKQKLVIVVSHDRDFALKYADRIIELADGRVVSDVSRDDSIGFESGEAGLTFENDSIRIPLGYHLTEQDRERINQYIDSVKNGVTLTTDDLPSSFNSFAPTDTNAIKVGKTGGFVPIKSQLPLKRAFAMGASSLKYKKLRLVITIILSVVAFTLFGLSDTFGAYDHITACTNSIIDTDVKYLSLTPQQEIKYDERHSYWQDVKFSQPMLDSIKKTTGFELKGVYLPSDSNNNNFNFTAQFDPEKLDDEGFASVRSTMFHGFAELTEKDTVQLGYKITAGRLPNGEKNEIAISLYTCDTFLRSGYKKPDGKKYQTVGKPADMLGKTLYIDGTEYSVCGVVDTGFNFDRYEKLAESDAGLSEADRLVLYALSTELDIERREGLCSVAFVGKGAIQKMISNQYCTRFNGNINLLVEKDKSAYTEVMYGDIVSRLGDLPDDNIIWFNAERPASLGDKEILINADKCLKDEGRLDYEELVEKLKGETFVFDAYFHDGTSLEESKDYKVVGLFVPDAKTEKTEFILPDSLYDRLVTDTDEIFRYAVCAMPQSKQQVKKAVEFCYDQSGDTRYKMNNAVTYELDIINETLKTLSKVFVYIGIGFAIFAALMLANFISTSVAYKKREIGILRAVGSRSNDVFRIFFAESFIIATINFVLSAIGVFAATSIINFAMREYTGILVTALNFGIRQVLLIMAVSLLVAFVASYIPVKRIASKRPVDAIRER